MENKIIHTAATGANSNVGWLNAWHSYTGSIWDVLNQLQLFIYSYESGWGAAKPI
jgi:hypothetical protein